MSILYASALIARLGPCHIFMDREPNAGLAQELMLQGCVVADLAAADTDRRGADVRRAGLFQWPGARIAAEAIGRYASMDVLVVISGDNDRRDVDDCLFRNGWQRHVSGMSCGEHADFTDDTLPGTTYYQRAGKDMACSRSHFRKGDADADLFLSRYAAAARHIRRGDRVLIDGEAYVDGAVAIAALSTAGSLVCVGRNGVRMPPLGMNAPDMVDADLVAVPDNSIDMIVALEPSTPAGWRARMEDYARILRYDGRIIIGWSADKGNAFRPIPASFAELEEAACDRFVPEARYIQSHDADGSRKVYPVGTRDARPSDWMILLASANPLDGAPWRDQFSHPGFPMPDVPGGPPPVIDFGAGYDNPYLYRSMVQIGERLVDQVKLGRVAECVIEDARPDSADRGAAIAVLGYRVLEQRLRDTVPLILALIEDYIVQSADTIGEPHVTRWRLSLSFLAGRLSELVEDRATAIFAYARASRMEWADFSPLLATKAIAAAFFEGRLHISGGDIAAAKACFQRGVATALAAAQSSHVAALGDPETPISFYLTELAEVMDMGSQCANAVVNLPLLARDPGLFWRHVDIRRFGLNTWATDLRNENARLRAAA